MLKGRWYELHYVNQRIEPVNQFARVVMVITQQS